MKLGLSVVVWTMLLSLLLVGCGEDSGEDDTNGDGAFGTACSINTDCGSGLCAVLGAGNFCSSTCGSDADCPGDACCDTTMSYCMLPVMCDSSSTDGDQDNVTNLCTQDEYRCNGDDLQRCNANHDWELYRDCAEEGKVCQTDQCVTADGDGTVDGDGLPVICEAGLRRCKSDSEDEIVQRCNLEGTAWEEYLVCDDGDECEDGQCVDHGEACTTAEGCTNAEQYCLPSTIGGTAGYCQPYCDAGGTCPRGWECDHGECQPVDGYCKSDHDCEMDEFCDKLPTADDGRCARFCDLQGENCPVLYHCVDNPSDLNYGRCLLDDSSCSQCSYDGECATGMYCELVAGQNVGCCRPQCSASNPCPGALVCNNEGRCVVGTGQGDCGGQCPPGYVCDPNFDQCVLNCPACGENQCCDATSAPNCYTCACQNPAVCGVLLPPCCFGYNCSAIIYGAIGYCI